jgi:hypothetical protein
LNAMKLRRAGSLLSALLSFVVGMPVNAQSPPPSANPTSAFDGIYTGVSAENNSSGNAVAGGRAPHTGLCWWGLRI